jgi:hypothetical protein
MVCMADQHVTNYHTTEQPEGYEPIGTFASPRWVIGCGRITPNSIGRVIGYRTFEDSDAAYVVDFGRYGLGVARPHAFDMLPHVDKV